MKLECPRCKSRVRELMDCDNCGTIGCMRCMKKSYGKWVCYSCEEPERYYPEMSEEKDVSDAFSAMFG